VIAEATVKTDRIDAKRLAHMLRADMLAESYVPSDEIRTLRDLVRTRKSLVEERTAEKNRIRAVLKRTDNAYDSALFGPTGREFLAELSLSEADRTIIEAHLSMIDEYDKQIENDWKRKSNGRHWNRQQPSGCCRFRVSVNPRLR
jgi:transposase